MRAPPHPAEAPGQPLPPWRMKDRGRQARRLGEADAAILACRQNRVLEAMRSISIMLGAPSGRQVYLYRWRPSGDRDEEDQKPAAYAHQGPGIPPSTKMHEPSRQAVGRRGQSHCSPQPYHHRLSASAPDARTAASRQPPPPIRSHERTSACESIPTAGLLLDPAERRLAVHPIPLPSSVDLRDGLSTSASARTKEAPAFTKAGA